LKNGVQGFPKSKETLDSGFRRNDGKEAFSTFCECIKIGKHEKGQGRQITPSSFVLSYPAKLTAGKLRAFVIGLWCFAAYSLPLTAYLISALDFGSGLDIA